jgi:hypothetical protein
MLLYRPLFVSTTSIDAVLPSHGLEDISISTIPGDPYYAKGIAY